jgi:integrase
MRYPKLKPKEWKQRPGTWIVSEPATHTPSGKRINHYFRSKNAALDWASRYREERLEYGNQAVTPEERSAILFFREHVGDLKLLPEVVRHWRLTAPESIQQIKVSDAMERFLDWRQHQGRWTRSTAEDTRGRLAIFERSLGDRFIHELTPADIEDFLSVRGSAGTRAKFFDKLRLLFRYAKLHRFIAIDPFENMRSPAVDYEEIEIYTPLELERMLTVAEQLHPDMVPFLALTAFGFLRTEELIPRFNGDPVLDWSAFDWTDGQIFVPHSVAKRARKNGGNHRSVPFNETLLHWIEPYKKESGRIVKREKVDAYKVLRKIRTKAGVRNVPNGLRHSCLTYWMASHGEESLGTVSRWSGNSPEICKKHYVATVKRAEGTAWLAIHRDSVASAPS